MRVKSDKNKTVKLQTRCTEKDFNMIKAKAMLYANGNISEWLSYASKMYVPSGQELADEKAPPKRGKSKR